MTVRRRKSGGLNEGESRNHKGRRLCRRGERPLEVDMDVFNLECDFLTLPAQLARFEQWADKNFPPDPNLRFISIWGRSRTPDWIDIRQRIECVRRHYHAGNVNLALNTLRHLEERVAQLMAPLIETGKKIHDAAARGGRPLGQKRSRDIELAREFKRLFNGARQSATAIKISLGKKHKLSRSAAIAAVDRGLKILSRIPL